MIGDNNTSFGGNELGQRSEWTEFGSPSTAVVVAVAEATGTDQAELGVLNDYIDGDALDALIADSPRPVEVTFEYDGMEVYVSSEGELTVDPVE